MWLLLAASKYFTFFYEFHVLICYHKALQYKNKGINIAIPDASDHEKKDSNGEDQGEENEENEKHEEENNHRDSNKKRLRNIQHLKPLKECDTLRRQIERHLLTELSE